MRKFKQEGARLRWKRIIEEHQESGLSVKEYCRQHGLNLTSFQWIRKISGKFLERTLRTSYNFLLCEPLPANPEAFNL